MSCPQTGDTNSAPDKKISTSSVNKKPPFSISSSSLDKEVKSSTVEKNLIAENTPTSNKRSLIANEKRKLHNRKYQSFDDCIETDSTAGTRRENFKQTLSVGEQSINSAGGEQFDSYFPDFNPSNTPTLSNSNTDSQVTQPNKKREKAFYASNINKSHRERTFAKGRSVDSYMNFDCQLLNPDEFGEKKINRDSFTDDKHRLCNQEGKSLNDDALFQKQLERRKKLVEEAFESLGLSQKVVIGDARMARDSNKKRGNEETFGRAKSWVCETRIRKPKI